MCWLCFEGYSRSIMIDRLKDVFYRFFLFSIDFCYIYIYCRKCNAEFNKLIKNSRSSCSFFRKLMLNTQFWLYLDIFRFSLIKSLCWNTTVNYILQTLKKENCLIERSYFLVKKGIHIVHLKKKNVYVTVLLFILYSIWVHVSSPKYKMICLTSPKSSQFAIFVNKQCSKIINIIILIFIIFNNYSIEFFL